MVSIVVLLAVLPVLAAIGGLFLALRSGDRGVRRWVTMAASGVVLASMGLFFSLPILAGRFQRLSYLEQADAATPWVRTGTGFALLALVMAFFAVRHARMCLIVASIISMFLWYGIGVSLV